MEAHRPTSAFQQSLKSADGQISKLGFTFRSMVVRIYESGDNDENEHPSTEDDVATTTVARPFDWEDLVRDNNYLWYLRDMKREQAGIQNRTQNTIAGGADDIRVNIRSPLTILALLFFVPMFSVELFFAISRGFICAGTWSSDLCSAYLGP